MDLNITAAALERECNQLSTRLDALHVQRTQLWELGMYDEVEMIDALAAIVGERFRTVVRQRAQALRTLNTRVRETLPAPAIPPRVNSSDGQATGQPDRKETD